MHSNPIELFYNGVRSYVDFLILNCHEIFLNFFFKFRTFSENIPELPKAKVQLSNEINFYGNIKLLIVIKSQFFVKSSHTNKIFTTGNYT